MRRTLALVFVGLLISANGSVRADLDKSGKELSGAPSPRKDAATTAPFKAGESLPAMSLDDYVSQVGAHESIFASEGIFDIPPNLDLDRAEKAREKSICEELSLASKAAQPHLSPPDEGKCAVISYDTNYKVLNNVFVWKSSGDDKFDDLAVQCIRKSVLKHDAKPVSGGGQFRFHAKFCVKSELTHTGFISCENAL